MIATNEAVDVLRHGWQDAASTLAADVPELAEILQARLEMAVTTGRLDEHHLLDTIQEVETLSSQSGSPSGPDLARRLRRTVYEYLLALDATRPLESTRAAVDQPAVAQDGPMVGAEEVAALGHASSSNAEAAAGGDAMAEAAAAQLHPFDDDLGGTAGLSDQGHDEEAGAAEPADGDETAADVPASRRRFALRRRQRHPGDAGYAGPLDAEPAGADPDATESAEPAADTPSWQFTGGSQPAVFDNGLAGPADEPAATAAQPDGPEPPPPSDAADPQPTAPEAAPGEDAPESTPSFVAPRAGFHIVEDAPSHRADQDEPRLQMPAFSADEPAPPAGETPPETPDEPVGGAEGLPGGTGPQTGSDFLAWHPPVVPAAPPEQPAPAVPQLSTPPVDAPAPAAPAEARTETDDLDSEARGWGVRRHGEAHAIRRGVPVVAVPRVEDDPFENNTRLSDMRRRIEERLRRKRCDEAAALLQEIAQETGGRAVAELAMNAGDRCRALGKSNAALNCYLAAARSDPVYELPLSRLADICIDNQDTELAVSYLERIARIYRFRGEDRAALRTYRRIATIAPYREDVLTLLMNAQRTGQLE